MKWLLLAGAAGVAYYLYTQSSGYSLSNTTNPQGVGSSLNSFLNFWGAGSVTPAA